MVTGAIALVAAACGEAAAPTLSPTPSATAAPTPQLAHLQGSTFAFDYPQGWHIWSQSYQSGQETVILANFPQQTPGRGGLPPGAIKIDLISTSNLNPPGLGPPPRDAQLLSLAPSNVKFFLWPGGEGGWTIHGTLRTRDRLYVAAVFMQTERPQVEAVAPILSSWRPLAP